jgi:hypothetical protein
LGGGFLGFPVWLGVFPCFLIFFCFCLLPSLAAEGTSRVMPPRRGCLSQSSVNADGEVPRLRPVSARSSTATRAESGRGGYAGLWLSADDLIKLNMIGSPGGVGTMERADQSQRCRCNIAR